MLKKYLIVLCFTSSSIFASMMDRAFDCIARVYILKPNVEINQNNFAHVVQLMKSHADQYIKAHPKTPDVVPTTLGQNPPPPPPGPVPTNLGGPKSPPRPSSGGGTGLSKPSAGELQKKIAEREAAKRNSEELLGSNPVDKENVVKNKEVENTQKLVNLLDETLKAKKMIPNPEPDKEESPQNLGDTGDGTNDEEWEEE